MNIPQLHKLFLKANSISTDTRKIQENDVYFALKGENFNGNIFAEKAINSGACYAIIDEQEYKKNDLYILVDDVLTTLQELANYHRKFLDIKIIALTGSNGKTTTKELINAVVSQNHRTIATKGNLNNHIGVPLTLLSMDTSTEIGIVEMGANHLKEIDFLCKIAEPNIGYITNFGKAHLEGFGSIEGVIKGKSELYNYIKTHQGLIIVNSENEKQLEQIDHYNSVYTFGSSIDNNVRLQFLHANPYVNVLYNNEKLKSKLIGAYNFDNISAAIAIGDYFNIRTESIRLAIENYCPQNNRSQIIEKNNTKIILDAYNANPTSMRAALSNLDKLEGNKIAVLGDMFELGKESEKEHQEIADFALKLNIDQVLLIGRNFSNIEYTSSKLKVFNSFENAKQKIKDSNFSNSVLLIKGSRGMALERILEFL